MGLTQHPAWFSVVKWTLAVLVVILAVQLYQNWEDSPTANPSSWPGENGKPYYPPYKQEVIDAAFKLHNFNVLASEKIAFNRSIPDSRPTA